MSHVDDGRLHAYLDGTLGGGGARSGARSGARTGAQGAEWAELEAHLTACAGCRARLETARAHRESAREVLGLLAPDDVRTPPFEEVLARRAGRPAAGSGGATATTTSRPARRAPRRFVPAAWAASIAVALAGGWLARGMLPQASGEGGAGGGGVRSAAPAAAPLVPEAAADVPQVAAAQEALTDAPRTAGRAEEGAAVASGDPEPVAGAAAPAVAAAAAALAAADAEPPVVTAAPGDADLRAAAAAAPPSGPPPAETTIVVTGSTGAARRRDVTDVASAAAPPPAANVPLPAAAPPPPAAAAVEQLREGMGAARDLTGLASLASLAGPGDPAFGEAVARTLSRWEAAADSGRAWTPISPAEAARLLARAPLEIEGLPWERMEAAVTGAGEALVRSVHPLGPLGALGEGRSVTLVQSRWDGAAVLETHAAAAGRVRLAEPPAARLLAMDAPGFTGAVAPGLGLVRDRLLVYLRGTLDREQMEALVARLR